MSVPIRSKVKQNLHGARDGMPAWGRSPLAYRIVFYINRISWKVKPAIDIVLNIIYFYLKQSQYS